MAVNEIKTLAHFIEACSEIEVKENHSLFYRGHSSDEFIPLPTVFRHQGDDVKNERFVVREEQLFHNLVTRCPEEFVSCKSTFDYLVKMQHYGLPTRLLDITSNPLVALYFACSSLAPKKSRDTTARDGQILIYQVPNHEIKFYNSDTVSVVSNLARVEADFNYEKNEHKGRFLHSIQAEKPYFKDKIRPTDLNSVICVKPKLDNRRIIKQSGAFFLFGMGEAKTDQIRVPDRYRPKVKNIDIPKNSKSALLKELEMLSISEATLFPEIDNVARYLKGEEVGKVPSSDLKDLLEGVEIPEADMNNYATIIAGALGSDPIIIEQLKNNNKEQAMQGHFSNAMSEAVIKSMEAHNGIAMKALSEDKVLEGISNAVFDILVNQQQKVQQQG